ncbi:HAD-IA family hydrolase [Pelagicoccus mobilis]|uniref:HAD-IA family hydrolase n=1 Tax=Pelagicoccus mobilis TaxID=415221 RepID=A0A934VNU3_9BACT|nr:HAD-IA family hydrolase [Pelagicoccus mobilis]MBK1876592.1 HAD-IA family hydrolase [Pelagicoccus mobilis]
MSFSNIKAITFDAGHTLYHPYPSVGAVYQEVMRQHGLDYPEDQLEEGFRRAFRSVSKDKTVLDGEQREWSYWQSIVKESISHLSPQPSDFDALFLDLWNEFGKGNRWKPESTAKETLTELRKRGYKIAVLSNWDSRVHQVLAETDFTPLLDHVFVSSEIGHEKPDREIFSHCEAKLELTPEQILHIGDSFQHDIEGASAAGWNAIRIVNEEDHSPNGYHSISQLNQLLTLLPGT